MVWVSGSPKTENVNGTTSWLRSAARRGSARARFRPVTMSARLPKEAAISPARASAPAPKIRCVAVPNSNCIGLQFVIRREDIREFHTGPRFGHHGFDSVAPDMVMRRGLMRRRSVRGAIGLDQQKARRIVLLLEDVESCNAGFFDAFFGIGEGGITKHLRVFSFNLYMNVNDKHR